MAKPLFLVYMMIQRKKDKVRSTLKKQMGNQNIQATNTNFYSMFHNSIGDKLIKAVYDSKHHPKFINRNILYLHYYL